MALVRLALGVAIGCLLVGAVYLAGDFVSVGSPGARENFAEVSEDDPEMNAAMAKARANLPRFWKLCAETERAICSVKFPLTQNGKTEYIWLVSVRRDGSKLVGVLDNEPVYGTAHRLGDQMSVEEADVVDWIVSTGSDIYGGYTSRVSLDQMPKEQRDELAPKFRD